jgi:hypothetical protein
MISDEELERIACLSNSAMVVCLDIMLEQVNGKTVEMARRSTPAEVAELGWIKAIRLAPPEAGATELAATARLAMRELEKWLRPPG